MSATRHVMPAAFDAGRPELPRLGDAAVRARLTPAAVDAMVRLAALWRLSSAEVSALMGDVSERTWFPDEEGVGGHPVTGRADANERADPASSRACGCCSRALVRRVGAAPQQGPALRRPAPARRP